MSRLMPISPETPAQARKLESLYVFLSSFGNVVDRAVMDNPEIATISSAGCSIKKFDENAPDGDEVAIDLEVSRKDLSASKRLYTAKNKLVRLPKCIEGEFDPFGRTLEIGIEYPVEEIEGYKLANINAPPETVSWQHTEITANKPKTLGSRAVESTIEITRFRVEIVRSIEDQLIASATSNRTLVLQRTSLPVSFLDVVNTARYAEITETAPNAQNLAEIDPAKIRKETEKTIALIQNTTW